MSQGDGGEVVERLKPKPSTIRRLYLLSGNLCAIPDCQKVLLDPRGVFVGKVAHITAAEKGGPRFDAGLTNEQRRSGDNLVLVCANHHDEVDQDLKRWTLQALKDVKAGHEARFAGAVDSILDSIRDWTEDQTYHMPGSLERIAKHQGFRIAEDELQGSKQAVMELADALRVVTRPARELLAVVISRARSTAGTDALAVGVGELERAARLSPQQLTGLVSELEQHRLAYLEPDFDSWDFREPYVATIARPEWPSWTELRDFTAAHDVTVADLVVDLRFDLLD